mmetsp:Transcript_14734/g.22712  ORF Transcript_14734/g.22712 Transcript_14734/m.22712 type:complete len:303 (-) Transcript_14734:225-1133(-)
MSGAHLFRESRAEAKPQTVVSSSHSHEGNLQDGMDAEISDGRCHPLDQTMLVFLLRTTTCLLFTEDWVMVKMRLFQQSQLLTSHQLPTYSMICGCSKYILAQATVRKMGSVPMDFVNVIQDFTASTALIQHVLDPCAATMTTTFSIVLIVATTAQKESKFRVNLMPKKTFLRDPPKVFAMGLVRVSALLRTSETTAAFWIVSTIAVLQVIVASSFRNQDASAKMDLRANTASTRNAKPTAPIRTEFAIVRLESACAMLYILLTIGGHRGQYGRAKTAPTCQHGVDKQLPMFGNHWLSLLSLP